MTQLKVRESRQDRGGFTHLLLEKPPGYNLVAGQYASLAFREGEKPKFLAIASHHDEAHLLFLSRDTALPAQSVAVSAPQGKGFAADFGDRHPFLYLTHGTGISAIRPAMLERKKRGFTADTLLYGIASANVEPELDCLREDFGIKQLRAFSNAEYKAYVQDLVDTLDLGDFGAILLVGSNEMMANCREILARKKFPAGKIFSNY